MLDTVWVKMNSDKRSKEGDSDRGVCLRCTRNMHKPRRRTYLGATTYVFRMWT